MSSPLAGFIDRHLRQFEAAVLHRDQRDAADRPALVHAEEDESALVYDLPLRIADDFSVLRLHLEEACDPGLVERAERVGKPWVEVDDLHDRHDMRWAAMANS